MTTTLLNTVSSEALKPFPKTKVALPSVTEIKEEEIYTINDLLVSRCSKAPNSPVLGYPASPRGKTDYVYHTNKDLDRFVDGTVKHLLAKGLPAKSQNNEDTVVAILAPSNLDYITSVFALSRLGYTVLFLSSRLATEAYISLLQKTKCQYILGSQATTKLIEAIQAEYPLTYFSVPERTSYDLSTSTTPPYQRLIVGPQETKRTAFIIHSSGSTGLPKPIFQSHGACLSNYSTSPGYRAFLTLPLYHNHGLSSFFRAMYSGVPIAMFNANLPLSGTNLLEAMETLKPESFLGVPYALKLLAETERGISALAKCKLVLFGGSSCPDELGNRLVEAGVYLVGHYGATEMGQLMTSARNSDDKEWSYLRPLPSVAKFLHFQSHGSNVYECVVLDGLPSKVVSNSSDPPNSFRTSDLFSPHSNIPNAWKYLGRADDRVTLMNGEKVLPIPLEHRVRQNELVKEAVVFGVGKAVPGILVIPSDGASSILKEELFDLIWPTIQSANKHVEGFSQISREMVEILPVGSDYPSTDKGTLIRAASYKRFADIIDSVYERFDQGPVGTDVKKLSLDRSELESYLLEVFKSRFGMSNLTDTTDFFEAGVDSLQAITIWGLLKRELDIGSATISQNVVFEYPNVKSLAAHLLAQRTGAGEAQEDELEIMGQLIQKYSSFRKFVPGSHGTDGQVVLLTGATGSLGAHVLAQLVSNSTVKTIYCLTRASSPETAQKRVLSTLAAKKLPKFDETNSKVICVPSDLSKPDLGLDSTMIEDLKKTLTVVIHCAWAVNFNLGVRSFEQQHIKGVWNLINLCLEVSTPLAARFHFCSSISAAAGTPLPAVIAETPVPDLSHTQNMGYARSKLVAERIIHAATEQTGMLARVHRVGQIIGDSEMGIWNTTEAIPLMIQSAVTMRALPALDETPSWMPVDKVAQSIIELSNLSGNSTHEDTKEVQDYSTVYHVQNPNLFHWTQDLLPALRNAGLSFETVSQREWVARLRQSDPDPVKNPTVKLLDFFTNKYDNDNMGRKGLVFVTDETERASETMRGGYDVIGSGLVDKLVAQWLKEW